MKKSLLIGFGVFFVVVLLLVGTVGGTYNRLVTAEEGVSEAWSQVENVYQRRSDLIPNLVNTVKGYAMHEKETLSAVINARAKATQTTISSDVVNDPALMAQFQQAQGTLSSALSRLLVSVERYPDLKANQNFLALQSQLEGTENRIAVERRRFNTVSKEFNTLRRKFPTVFLANMMGFKEKTYFKAEAGAEKAPEVQF